jgi:hypothetical protein
MWYNVCLIWFMFLCYKFCFCSFLFQSNFMKLVYIGQDFSYYTFHFICISIIINFFDFFLYFIFNIFLYILFIISICLSKKISKFIYKIKWNKEKCILLFFFCVFVYFDYLIFLFVWKCSNDLFIVNLF